MKIARTLAYDPPISWPALPELPSVLSRFSVTVESNKVALDWFPDEIECEALEEATALVKKRGEPDSYRFSIHGQQGDKKTVSLYVSRVSNMHGQEFHTISLEGIADDALLEAVTSFLGLRKYVFVPKAPRSTPIRSVFVAHRFDEVGTTCADKVARFFELLGFSVKSGRGFSPTSIAKKVKDRIQTQAIIIVILTAGEDATWLIQESVFGEANNKPVIVLRDQAADFKSALFGDREFIPFTPSAVDATFIPLLEGLRELGYAPLLGDDEDKK